MKTKSDKNTSRTPEEKINAESLSSNSLKELFQNQPQVKKK